MCQSHVQTTGAGALSRLWRYNLSGNARAGASRNAILFLLIAIVLFAVKICLVQPASARTETKTVQHSASNFLTDIKGVREEHLRAQYWIGQSKSAENRVILDRQGIQALNRLTFAVDENLLSVADLPLSLSREDILDRIRSVSRRPPSPRYYSDGREVTDSDYREYEKALNIAALDDVVPVQFALVVRRTGMRSFPTRVRVFSGTDDLDLDLFQETALFPGDAVAVLHESQDKKWVFARSYHYAAWVPKSDIAMGTREDVLSYHGRDKAYLVVTGDKVETVYTPEDPRVSRVSLDMGVRLPLIASGTLGHSLNGQNPYTGYAVRLPVRKTEDGTLEFAPAVIARSRDVSPGYPEFTHHNLIRQSFKFLGERYGWGHDYGGRDCSGFISEIYRSFGILMPRNSGQQGTSEFGVNIRFDDNAPMREKLEAINTLEPGDLIYIPGHVMMFLGVDGGTPYVIHSVKGYSHLEPDGTLYSGTLNGVSVTPLTTLHKSSGTSFIDEIYNLKKIRYPLSDMR